MHSTGLDSKSYSVKLKKNCLNHSIKKNPYWTIDVALCLFVLFLVFSHHQELCDTNTIKIIMKCINQMVLLQLQGILDLRQCRQMSTWGIRQGWDPLIYLACSQYACYKYESAACPTRVQYWLYTADMLAALGTTLCGLIVWLYTNSLLSLTTTWVPNFPCTW